MIEHRGSFTENEILFIELLDRCLTKLFFAEGSVIKTGEDVLYEVYIGCQDSYESKDLFMLQFCVRDHEDLASGFCNFVHISNIKVPCKYRRQGVATRIIFVMSYVATREVGIDLYVACLTNNFWKEKLISAGSTVDDDGDIQIFYEPFMEHFQSRLMFPNYLT